MAQPGTIFALSTAQGRSGVAVIRISGGDADGALFSLAGRLPPCRVATLVLLRDPHTQEMLDQALALRFAKGASFTGECCVELQVHGSRSVIKDVLQALASCPGLRPAEPGEFTLRALENGRLDLTQVEALADLINADTRMQRQQALRGLAGILGAKVQEWRRLLVEAKAIVAAEIDFSDEGDVGENASSEIDSLLEQLRAQFQTALASFDRGRLVSEGVRVAIVGRPNVGKSTLLNTLAGSEVAIVSQQAGTTRDVLHVELDLSGYHFVLMDTAGVRDTLDPVEKIGVDRAKAAAGAADLLLLLDDGCDQREPCEAWNGVPLIRIRTKSDIGDWDESEYDLALSCETGEGIDSLQKQLVAFASDADAVEAPLITHQRQKLCVVNALDQCHLAQQDQALGVEFVSESLERIDQALSELTGAIGVEEVLGAIFSRFCIGK